MGSGLVGDVSVSANSSAKGGDTKLGDITFYNYGDGGSAATSLPAGTSLGIATLGASKKKVLIVAAVVTVLALVVWYFYRRRT